MMIFRCKGLKESSIYVLINDINIFFFFQGFHRYSTDRFWHVPHFEKMLYDQAQLAALYADGFQVV